MSNDEYKRILLQVIQELRDQGWSDEDIADADIRIRETDDHVFDGNPPARWDKYATEEDTPTMVSELMATANIKYKIKGVFKG